MLWNMIWIGQVSRKKHAQSGWNSTGLCCKNSRPQLPNKKSLTLYLASIPLPWRYHLKTAGTFGQNFINTSQSIHRMISGSSDLVPCITPSGTLWSMRHKRYLTGRDVQTKMVSHVLNIGSTAFQKMHANMFWPWNHSGIEKLLCQSFPVHQLKLAHLTNAGLGLKFNIITIMWSLETDFIE